MVSRQQCQTVRRRLHRGHHRSLPRLVNASVPGSRRVLQLLQASRLWRVPELRSSDGSEVERCKGAGGSEMIMVVDEGGVARVSTLLSFSEGSGYGSSIVLFKMLKGN